LASVGCVAEFEICLGEQIEILRLIGMLGDFFGELFDVELGAIVFGKIGAGADVVEKILIRIRAGCRVFGKRLKDVQIALGGFVLMKIALDHREFVIAGGGFVAHLDVFS